MIWSVTISRKTAKNLHRWPQQVKNSLTALIREIEVAGPVRGNWPNYAKLGKDKHHCHLTKGQPTYVAVWNEKGSDMKDNIVIELVEVTYVGTHEKAPY